jgi:AcrR family transcriptional regulator
LSDLASFRANLFANLAKIRPTLGTTRKGFTMSTAATRSASGKRGTYANGQQRREELVSKALELFAAQGFQRLSLRKIAEALGVSHAALSYHFPTKEALLEAVFEEQAGREEPVLRGELETRGLLDALPDIIRHNEEIPGIIQLDVTIQAEAVRPDHEAHDWAKQRMNDAIALTREQLELERDRGRLRADIDLDVAARLIIAAGRGMQFQWLYDRETSLEAHMAALAALLRA